MTRKNFRILIGTAIISFLIFQGITIASNQKYGTIYSISSESHVRLISPNQPSLVVNAFPSHVYDDNTYYSLNYQHSTDNIPELLKVTFDDELSEMKQVDLITNLNLSLALQYRGLVIAENSLWTLGLYEQAVDNTTVNLHRVVFQMDLDGKIIEQIPLPILQFNPEIDRGIDSHHLIYANSTTLTWLFTPKSEEASLVFMNLTPRKFTEEDLGKTFHEGIGHISSGKLYLYYQADPFDLEEASTDNSITLNDADAGLYAMSFGSTSDKFVETITFERLTGPATQVLPSTVISDTINQPILAEEDSNFLTIGDKTVRPVFVHNSSSPQIQVFYGFEIYQLSSQFFTPLKIAFLSISILSLISGIIVKFKLDNNALRHTDIPIKEPIN